MLVFRYPVFKVQVKSMLTMSLSCRKRSGGDKEDRTPDLLRARQALSQLSYVPEL